jgi:hypothetical protein
MFVDVPLRVQVPPNVDAYARDINNFETFTFAFFARAVTPGRNITVAATLFTKIETATRVG